MKPQPTPLLVTVEEAGALIRKGKTMTFQLLKDGELEGVMLSGRRMVVYSSITAFVERLRAAAKTPEAA